MKVNLKRNLKNKQNNNPQKSPKYSGSFHYLDKTYVFVYDNNGNRLFKREYAYTLCSMEELDFLVMLRKEKEEIEYYTLFRDTHLI